MSDKRNIDGLFKDASAAFTPKAPSAAWSRIEASLKKQRRRKMFLWWIIAIIFLASSSLVSTYFLSNFGDASLAPVADHSSTKPLNDLNNSSSSSSISSSDSKSNGIDEVLQKPIQSKTNTNITKKSGQQVEFETSNNHLSSQEKKVENQFATNNKMKQMEEVSESSHQSNISQSVEPEQTDLIITDSDFSDEPDSTLTIFSKVDSLGIKVDTLLEHNAIVEDDSISKMDSLSEVMKISNRNPIAFFGAFSLGFGFSGAFYQQPDNQISTISSVTELDHTYTNSKEVSIGAYWKNWEISTGFSRVNLRFSGDLNLPSRNIKYIDTENFGTSPLGYFSLYNIENVMQGRHYSNIDYLRHFERTRFEFNSLQLSFRLGRIVQLRNWYFIYGAGASTLFLRSNVVSGRDEFGFTDWGSVSDLRSSLFMLSPYVQMNYYTRSGFFIGLNADLNLALNSANKSSDFRFKPYTFFVGPKIGYKF